MVKRPKLATVIGTIIGVVALMALGGCSSSEENAPRSEPVHATFLLDQCQQLEANLYKCPSVDKPLCTPDFVRTNVECIRIGRKGSVFVQRGVDATVP